VALVELLVVERLWVVVDGPWWPVEEADDVVRELAVAVGSFDEGFDGVVKQHVENAAVVVGDVEDAAAVEAEAVGVEQRACSAVDLVSAVVELVVGLEVRMDLAIPISQVVL
jgi:hypothetical protein